MNSNSKNEFQLNLNLGLYISRAVLTPLNMMKYENPITSVHFVWSYVLI